LSTFGRDVDRSAERVSNFDQFFIGLSITL